MAIQKLPLHRLPLPPTTLQHTLSELPLADQPSAQRRATTFKTDSEGVWARVNPLWSPWPLRMTKAEALAMGVDVDKGQQVSVEDVLARWDPKELEHTGIPHDPEEGESNGLNTFSSAHRMKLEPILLGVSTSTLNDALPHLTVGDAPTICNRGASPSPDATPAALVRNALVDILSGRKVLKSETEPNEQGNEARQTGEQKDYGPWSTRYCGHQFGVWAGQLGDGRAISILETQSEEGGRQELQLKGAGRTPFSRTADGLAVLRSGVREFLGCEAIAALDIRTTRALALLTLPLPSLPVIREQGSEPTSLLCRVAPSFIRIGHFQALNPAASDVGMRQFFMGGSGWLNDQTENGDQDREGNLEGLRKLTEWVKGDIMDMKEQSIKEWVEEVVRRNAQTVAKWQVYGWMHGVLNTDNISLTGDTIDFGPYAFMDVYDDKHICNHSDPSGLYSYRNQPPRVLFALEKLVASLAPLIGYEATHSIPPPSGFSEGLSKETRKEWEGKAEEVMDGWEKVFWEVQKDEERRGWTKRFGLKTYKDSDDRDITYDYFALLQAHSIDFHTSFRLLSKFRPSQVISDDSGSSSSSSEYLDTFASDFIQQTTTSSATAAACTIDSVSPAKDAFKSWLISYAARSTADEEKTAYGGIASAQEFDQAREKAMKAVNPRFVLRQWVLEETIAKMEQALTHPYIEAQEKGKQQPEEWKVDEGIREARRVLAKILDMSTRPFQPYGEGAEYPGPGKGSPSSSKAEWEEDRRLCGLGDKDMLGFQCSCSS
ncbi:hypothetical protein I317_07581 [Kwoniella heveanensis CBS 569]|nr:hypothetical protein I317_07581 [Kwoniella heveanensis CBS 569]